MKLCLAAKTSKNKLQGHTLLPEVHFNSSPKLGNTKKVPHKRIRVWTDVGYSNLGRGRRGQIAAARQAHALRSAVRQGKTGQELLPASFISSGPFAEAPVASGMVLK